MDGLIIKDVDDGNYIFYGDFQESRFSYDIPVTDIFIEDLDT